MTMAAKPLFSKSAGRDGGASRDFTRHVAVACWAAALLMALGSLLDWGVLWVAQRQATLEWEFVALSRTMEGVPRFVLGLALVMAALHFGRVRGAAAYRLVGTAFILTGLTGMALAGLMLTDYYALAGRVADDSRAVFKSTVFKSIALGALYGAVLVPMGVISLRGPKK